MTFDRLYSLSGAWVEYKYLPLMDRLMVFNPQGERVAEWFVQCSNINGIPYKWSFHCLVDIFDKGSAILEGIIEEWKKLVEARFKECVNG